jgi:cyclopropane-fatty-acyl-phospholipid synthase
MNQSHLFTLEHSKLAYLADFAFYGAAPVALAIFLTVAGPPMQRLETIALALIGLASWTLIEYALHRFVLHGLQPFRAWHEAHHRHPAARICTPTPVSATLITVLVFIPALILGGLWRGCALTLGVLTGYFAYSVMHHATHHWHAGNAWFKRRQRWHALHHRPSRQPGHYGVTSAFWDHVFGSDHGP